MLTEIERLTAQWWFDPALSVGLGLLTWVIGGLFTYWLFQRDQKLRLAEQLRDFALRAKSIRSSLRSSDESHQIILNYELENLQKNLKFADYGVRIDKIVECGKVFLEKAEVQLNATVHFDAKYNQFIDALKAGIRKLGWAGRYGDMLRELEQIKRPVKQGEPSKKGWFARKPSVQLASYHAGLFEIEPQALVAPDRRNHPTDFVVSG